MLPDSSITVIVIRLQPEPPPTLAGAASGDWLLKGDHQPLVWLPELGDQSLQVWEELLLNAFHGLQRHRGAPWSPYAPGRPPPVNQAQTAQCRPQATRDPASRGEEGDHGTQLRPPRGSLRAVPVDMPGAGVVDGWREVQTHGFHAREGRVQSSRGRGGRRRPTQAAGPSGGRALTPCPQLGTKDSSHQRTGARTAQGLRFLTLRGSALWPPLAPVAAALPTEGGGHGPAGLQVARLPDGVRLTLRSCGEASGEGPRQPGRQHRRPRGLWLACRPVRAGHPVCQGGHKGGAVQSMPRFRRQCVWKQFRT